MNSFVVEKRDNIAVFILNRPQKNNAFTPDLIREMEEGLHEFMLDDSMRAGIITGAGNKAFCAGADIKEWLPFVKETADRPWDVPTTPMRGMNVTKPLIAAVNGLAYGGGAEIALSCDIRIASENASFRFPEPALGILPRFGGTQRLPRLIGYSRAMEILLTNAAIDAEKALEIGLVSQMVPEDKLMDAAMEIAEKICKLAPLAVQGIKKCISEGYNKSLEEGLELENRIGMSLFKTEDYLEGSAAFKEKRKPCFKGK